MMAQLPAWLSYTFGLVMLAVAAYNFDLLAFSISGRYLPGSDAEISEIFCGISMAGMFVSDWAFGPTWIWRSIFLLLLIWFTTRSISSLVRSGPHIPRPAIHVVMSGGMLLMFSMQSGSPSAHSTSMMMTMSPSSPLDATTAYFLAVILLAEAVVALLVPGHAHDAPQRRRVVSLANPSGWNDSAGETYEDPVIDGIAGFLMRPKLTTFGHASMCGGMALMLILMA